MSFGSNSYGSSAYSGINAFNIFRKAISAVLVLSETRISDDNKKLSEVFSVEELTTAIKDFEKRNIEILSLSELKYVIYEFLRSNVETISLSEELYKSVSITISSNFNLDEASSLFAQYTRNYSETIQIAEDVIKSVEKRNIETVYFSDMQYLLNEYKRSYSETLSLSENISKKFDKINTASLSLIDILSLQNEFKRSFSNSFTLTDLKEILNQYRKDNRESLSFVENINKKVEKTISTLFLLELSVKQIEYFKKISNSFSFFDENKKNIFKKLYEFYTQYNDIDTTYNDLSKNYVGKNGMLLKDSLKKEDILSFDDIFSLTSFLSSKTESDLRFLESIFLTEESYRISKKILSSVENFTESIDLFNTNELRLNSNFSIQSSLIISTVKNILTTILLSEDIDKTLLFYKSFLENISLNEYLNKEVLSKRADSISLIDLLSFSSDKELIDSFSISEEVKKTTDLIKNEIFSFLESTIKEENLRKQDLLLISEIIKKDISTRKTDSLSLTDFFQSFFVICLLRTDGFYVTESIIKEIRKQNIEQINFSIFEKKDILQKLTDSEDFVETISKENSFKVADMFAITELISKHIRIPENEAILITEDSNIITDKNISLNLSFLESNRKQYFAEFIDEERFIDLISKSKEKNIIDHFSFIETVEKSNKRKIAPKTTLITKKGKSYLLMK